MKTEKEPGRLEDRKRRIKELTSYLLHKHYGENDVESILAHFDDVFAWLGTGEEEYALGTEQVSGIFRQFAGMVPKCTLAEEDYHVLELTPEVYLCMGRVWITTDPSTNIFLRVHQRVTTVFRWVGDAPRCCHIHVSNPYSAMTESDVGFPTQLGNQTYEYLQECVAHQKKQIEAQTAQLHRMSFEDTSTGLYNRNKFNQVLDHYNGEGKTSLGVACFDLNGLKAINDRHGHGAGDDVIRRVAAHIREAFPGKGYRIGGDEFVIIDEDLEEEAFQALVHRVYGGMKAEGLSISMGLCWRGSDCDMQAQVDLADRLMYQDKAAYYRLQGNDRRKR